MRSGELEAKTDRRAIRTRRLERVLAQTRTEERAFLKVRAERRALRSALTLWTFDRLRR